MRTIAIFTSLLVLLAGSTRASEPASLQDVGLVSAPLVSSGLSVGQYDLSDSLDARHFTFESGYLRQFDLSDLDTRFVFASGRFNTLTLGLGLSQLGNSDYYSEQVVQLGVGVISQNLRGSFTASYTAENFGSRFDKIDAFAWGMGMAYYSPKISLAVVGDNLNEPSLYGLAPPLYTAVSVYLMMNTIAGSTTTFRQKFEEGHAPQYHLFQRFVISRRGDIFWGFTANPFRYSAGISLKYNAYAVTYVVNRHPVLGLSHGILIGYNTSTGAEIPQTGKTK